MEKNLKGFLAKQADTLKAKETQCDVDVTEDRTKTSCLSVLGIRWTKPKTADRTCCNAQGTGVAARLYFDQGSALTLTLSLSHNCTLTQMFAVTWSSREKSPRAENHSSSSHEGNGKKSLGHYDEGSVFLLINHYLSHTHTLCPCVWESRSRCSQCVKNADESCKCVVSQVDHNNWMSVPETGWIGWARRTVKSTSPFYHSYLTHCILWKCSRILCVLASVFFLE